MRDYLSLIDYDTTGNRCDVTPLFSNPVAFGRLLDDLCGLVRAIDFSAVAAVDALGFILGTGIALRTGRGLIVVRKGGKLPVEAESAHFIDYTGQRKSLEIRTDAVAAGARVLVVDEWVETGAQVRSVISLLERFGGVVSGVASINIDREAATLLERDGYKCFFVSRD